MKSSEKATVYGFSLVFALFLWMPGVAGAEGADQVQAETAQVRSQDAASNENVPTTEVEVNANKDKAPKEGSAAAGYKPDTTTTTGPWGKMRLQDTPYSINVMSADLIENIQASTMDQLLRINPLVQVNYGFNRTGSGWVSMRGFSGIPAREDGVRANSAQYGVFLENVDRVEAISGLSGFLYGPTDIGGVINYILKRPTAQPLSNVTIGDFGGSNYYIHGDFGGPLGKDDKFGYRLNFLDQNGGTSIAGQSIKRQLVSGAVDWHIADNALFQFDASHSYAYTHGVTTAILPSGATPAAPSLDHLLSPSWAYNEVTSNDYGTKLTWNINDNLTLRSGYRYRKTQQSDILPNDSISPSGVITNSLFNVVFPNGDTNTGYYTYIDDKFNTGSVGHKITFGISGDTDKRFSTGSGNLVLRSGINYPIPTDFTNFPKPSYISPTTGEYLASKTINTNVTIGDAITFTDRWSALLGINHTRIEATSYNASGTLNGTPYDKSATTPSASLIYNPSTSLTAYFTYMEGLEQGGTAPITYNSVLVTNRGQVLAPMVDKQYELGVKQNAGKTLLTYALFRIEKANQYVDSSYTYVQDGMQVNKGFEFTATGKVTDRLTVVGGFTIMSCMVTKTNTPSLLGTRPGDIANQMAKVYVEYEMPNTPGLFLTGGAYYNGPFKNYANTYAYPGVTTFDLGARYQTKLNGAPITYRLNVSNLFNKNYWIASYYVGAPRTISLSATMNL